MKNNFKYTAFIVLLLLVTYFVFVFLISSKTINNYYQGILMLIMINVMLAVSLNLVTGFLGQLTLGHAGFMAIGAYVSALFTKAVELPDILSFAIALILAGIAAAAAGIIIGIPALRLKGDYIAILTLSAGEIIRGLIIYFDEYTGGSRGMKMIPGYSNFSNVFWIMIITIFVIYSIIHSRHGRAIIAIREDEIAAESVGINIVNYKLFAFCVSAFFAGVAGALFAHYNTLLDPNNFDYNYSIEMLIMVVFGGMGSLTGSIVAALGLTALPQILSDFSNYRMLLYSILLIIIMLFKPSGLFGTHEFSITAISGFFKNKKSKTRKRGDI